MSFKTKAKPQRGIFFVVACFCCIVIASVIISRRISLKTSPSNDNSSTESSATAASVAIKNLILKEYDSKKKYELTLCSEKSDFHHVSNTIICHTIVCHVHHQKTPLASVNAEQATIDRTNKQILFQGQVQGQCKDIRIQSQDMLYNFSTQIIQAPLPTLYTHSFFTLQAEQSIVDIQEQKISMTAGVRTEISYGTTTDNGSY